MMVCDSAGPEPAGGAGTLGSGRPRGNPNLAPRCGAKTRAGLACQAPGMANGRCRIHGGTSTGPRTPKGFSRLAAAHTTSGTYAAANSIRDRYFRVLACRVRVFCAAKRVRAYLPPALAARLATTPPEFMPPVHYSNTLNSEITTKTLWSGGRDPGGTPCGSSTARSRPGPRGRAEQLEAARAERQVLAPWRAAIAGARLAKREALAGRRAARIVKTRQRPYGASAAAGTESANRPEGVAAVEARLGAAWLGAVAGGEAEIDATGQKPCGGSTGAGMWAAVKAPEVLGDSTGGVVPRRMAGTSPAMTKRSPAVVKSENHDKDPMDPRTVRWPWGGLKGRLCGGTSLGGLLPGVTQPGTWQAVLEASNAAEARKTWRPHQDLTWPDAITPRPGAGPSCLRVLPADPRPRCPHPGPPNAGPSPSR
jgi:hypothetical protein